MSITLHITAGPHAGQNFAFDQHDTFLVGRSSDAHLQLSYDDPYFSRRHFLVEMNPPRCRVIDLNSRNGIFVNDVRILSAELVDGDEIRAGHTTFRVAIPPPKPDEQETMLLPPKLVPAPVDPPVVAVTQPPVPFEELVPGYTLGEELGRGAMGVVYRAVRSSDGHVVAIKVITPVAGAGDKKCQRFVREAKLMASLQHDNIVSYHESGTSATVIYLVMELVDGMDASRHVAMTGPLPVRIAVRMICQMLAGLGHAHAAGIVHRDIKPSNLLVGGLKGKRVAKLADFGLARMFEECRLSGLTFQGEIGGTPAYMAPEQVTHFREVKPAADQYSAAATLYNLLTSVYPHDMPKDVGKQFAVIITEPIIPLPERRPDVPAALAAVLHKALAREPAQRYADVGEFRQALLPFAR